MLRIARTDVPWREMPDLLGCRVKAATDGPWSDTVNAIPVPTPTPTPALPSLSTPFADASLHHEATLVLGMVHHFSGADLTYTVEVTTTHQRTGQQHIGALNEIARNKVTGAWNGSLLTLTAGHAPSQTLTIAITATDDVGASVTDEFILTLDN